jgi:hypothetical protein
MGGRRLSTGGRLYGGHNGFGPGESPDVAPVQMTGHLPVEAESIRSKPLTASDTDQRLYGVAQSSDWMGDVSSERQDSDGCARFPWHSHCNELFRDERRWQ